MLCEVFPKLPEDFANFSLQCTVRFELSTCLQGGCVGMASGSGVGGASAGEGSIR